VPGHVDDAGGAYGRVYDHGRIGDPETHGEIRYRTCAV